MAHPDARKTLDAIAAVSMTAASGLLIWSLVKPEASPRSRPEPALPSEPISIAGAASKGSLAAPVVVIEFADFQCPYCGTFADRILPELETEFISTGKVLFVLRHLPLESIHPAAKPAAVAAHCAGEAGRFWEMHALLWRESRNLIADGVFALADGMPSLDHAAYRECLRSAGPAAVAADIELARSLGVRSTPTFFVGESTPAGLRATRRVSGAAALDVFRDAIDEVLVRSDRVTRRATEGGRP